MVTWHLGAIDSFLSDISVSLAVIADNMSSEDKGTDIAKIRAEIEKTYMNITYQENKDRKAAWGLRKALEIIDKYKAEGSSEE